MTEKWILIIPLLENSLYFLISPFLKPLGGLSPPCPPNDATPDFMEATFMKFNKKSIF